VWLLEELNLEYELKVFKRNAEFRAGDDLKQVHPLGRSPMIGITPAGSDKEILIFESATIVDYVCEHFGRRMLPKRYPEGKEGVLGAENEDFMRYRVSYTFSLRLYGIACICMSHNVSAMDAYLLAGPHRLCLSDVVTLQLYPPGLSRSSLYTIDHTFIQELT
jgi:hypothetical protein